MRMYFLSLIFSWKLKYANESFSESYHLEFHIANLFFDDVIFLPSYFMHNSYLP